MEKINKIPAAKTMLIGLRQMGYSFSTALADIIDNCIAAHANKIWVDAEPCNFEPYLYVLDNGFGMDKEKLLDAMSFGSTSVHDGSDILDLGRFGLGLNTASLSQCRKFTVLTKKDGNIFGARWDVDALEKTTEWPLFVLEDCELNKVPGYEELNSLSSGTLVVWNNFDKLNTVSSSFESSFRDRLSKARSHCELVFHRFYNEIEIYFNDDRINKRDPFLEDFDSAQHREEEHLLLENNKIFYQAHVLPHTNSLTNEEKDLLGGVSTMKNEQGFYLYRNKRLIIWGSWLGMNNRTEFCKLARIRVDIPTSLDFMWQLDVKKTSAAIPDSLRSKLWAVVDDASKGSTRTFRYKGEREYSGKKEKIWIRTKTRDGEIKYEINENLPIISYFINKLDNKDVVLFDSLLNQIVDYLPKHHLNVDINDAEVKLCNGEEKEDINEIIDELATILSKFPKDVRENICQEYFKFENYVVLSDKKELILKKADEIHAN